MICPNCKKNIEVAPRVFWNVEAYGDSAIARTECCGAGVRISRVVSFKADLPYDCPDVDDWGEKLTPTPLQKFLAYEKA